LFSSTVNRMNVFSKPVLRQENETKSENSSKNNFKRKMTVRNSVGNQHKFAQQLPKEAKRTCSSSEEDKLARSEHIEDTKIQNAVDKLSFCCPSSLDDGYGCLLKLFRDTSPGSENTTSYSNYDYFECYKRAVTYVKQCRQLGKQDNSQLSEKENRDNFLQEVFRECIIDQEKLSNGKEKFSFKFCIPSINNRLGNANRHVVCKQTLLSVYGFTEHDWRICSSALKTTDTGRVSSLRHKPWTDDVLHDYTFAEAEDVFADELGVPKPGQLIESNN